MQIQTSRFGTVELSADDILDFPEGLLGFTNLRKFVLLDDPTDEVFAWLQSCEEAAIAFPVLEPELFTSNYEVKLTKRDLEALSLESQDQARYFCIITIPQDPREMTANLKAPLVVSPKTKKARQCVLQDNNLAIREPIFASLQQRVVQSQPSSIKSQAFGWGVAVQLPNPTRDQVI